jgi:hypothetical protein
MEESYDSSLDDGVMKRRVAVIYKQRLKELRMVAPIAYAQLCLRPLQPENYDLIEMKALLVEIETILIELVVMNRQSVGDDTDD